MRTFLGLLMWLIVSGANEAPIEGYLNGSVLLPCNCSGREGVVKWQIKKRDGVHRVLEFNGMHLTESFDSYKGRVTIFVVENSGNCSLHLTDITAEDQGNYKCIYKVQGAYRYDEKELNIFGDSTTSRLNCSMGCFKIIPIMLVLGLSLVMWRAAIE